jgi:hypothetical protein
VPRAIATDIRGERQQQGGSSWGGQYPELVDHKEQAFGFGHRGWGEAGCSAGRRSDVSGGGAGRGSLRAGQGEGRKRRAGGTRLPAGRNTTLKKEGRGGGGRGGGGGGGRGGRGGRGGGGGGGGGGERDDEVPVLLDVDVEVEVSKMEKIATRMDSMERERVGKKIGGEDREHGDEKDATMRMRCEGKEREDEEKNQDLREEHGTVAAVLETVMISRGGSAASGESSIKAAVTEDDAEDGILIHISVGDDEHGAAAADVDAPSHVALDAAQSGLGSNSNNNRDDSSSGVGGGEAGGAGGAGGVVDDVADFDIGSIVVLADESTYPPPCEDCASKQQKFHKCFATGHVMRKTKNQKTPVKCEACRWNKKSTALSCHTKGHWSHEGWTLERNYYEFLPEEFKALVGKKLAKRREEAENMPSARRKRHQDECEEARKRRRSSNGASGQAEVGEDAGARKRGKVDIGNGKDRSHGEGHGVKDRKGNVCGGDVDFDADCVDAPDEDVDDDEVMEKFDLNEKRYCLLDGVAYEVRILEVEEYEPDPSHQPTTHFCPFLLISPVIFECSPPIWVEGPGTYRTSRQAQSVSSLQGQSLGGALGGVQQAERYAGALFEHTAKRLCPNLCSFLPAIQRADVLKACQE